MYRTLCMPSKVYLVISIFFLVLTVFAPNVFGGMSVLGHVIHVVYILFWTWILNLICGAGYKWVSWVLVLVPYVFVMLAVLVAISQVDSELAATSMIASPQY